MLENNDLSTSTASINFFLAEDFREEVGGTVSAVGLYPSNIIVIVMGPDDPEPSPESPAALRSLAMLMCVSDLNSDAEIKIELSGPSGTQVLGTQLVKYPGPKRSANLIVRMAPAIMQHFGRRSIRVWIGDKPHEFFYEAVRGPLA